MDKTGDTIDQTQDDTVSAGEDDSFLSNLLEDTWQPSTYHEGTRYATVTPLSLRLAIITAHQFTTVQQPTASTDNEVRPDLDPWLEARTQPNYTVCTSPSLPALYRPHGHATGANQGRRREDRYGDCREELQKARDEIKSKDRRIRELELALHEAEGWTDAVTYPEGRKRPRM